LNAESGKQKAELEAVGHLGGTFQSGTFDCKVGRFNSGST
jgi:hypothetical protein